MRLSEIRIENYRSIRSLHLLGLGPMNVLYGENGVGKSNILSALSLLGQIVARCFNGAEQLKTVFVGDLVRANDFCLSTVGPIRLLIAAGEATFSMEIHRGFPEAAHTTYQGGSVDLQAFMREAGLYLIPAIHSLGAERERDMADEGREEARLARLLGQGRLKEALFRALTSRDRLTRRRFEDFREFLRGAPLYRPRFDPVQNPDGTFDLQEDFPATDQALSLDLAGLGVQQLYAILASIMLSGAPIIGLEEPEVHLHGPTSGAHLRRLLRRLVDEGRVQQMFIATHSNLFDLDPTGYWEVRLDPERGTVVERRPLADLDGRHLYEPGPARHALLDMLKFLPVDQPVFRRADGSAITGPEMIQMLQEDSPEAFDFLRDVSAAAVRAVQVRARKAP